MVTSQQFEPYDPLTKLFHWLSALLVIILFFSGDWMVDLGYYHAWYDDSHWWHISLGLLLALILPLRFFWRIFGANRPSLVHCSKKQDLFIDLVHYLLYLLILMICISGFVLASVNDEEILFFGWFEIPALFFDDFEWVETVSQNSHQYMAYVLMLLVIFHSIAAIKHHFYNKDWVLRQMLPW